MDTYCVYWDKIKTTAKNYAISIFLLPLNGVASKNIPNDTKNDILEAKGNFFLRIQESFKQGSQVFQLSDLMHTCGRKFLICTLK
jgi:hypothetical protein